MAHAAPDFGTGRTFADDPENIGIPTILGDLTALNLQILQLMRAATADNACRNAIDILIAQTTLVLEAANACETRELSIRELQPITRVPDVPYGDKENFTNLRMNNIPIFNGNIKDTIGVLQWISRILNLAESNRLTFKATVNLLIECSSHGAAIHISNLKEENKTLFQIIQYLEARYVPISTLEEECDYLTKKVNENLFSFIDRLRMTAKIECRHEPNKALRRQSEESLVSRNILRILPSSIKNILDERLMNRSLSGLPVLTSREIENQCLLICKTEEA